MDFLETLEIAGQYDDTLPSTDPRFRRSVLLIHDDGSIFIIKSSFLMKKDEWLVVFSEHHPFSIYHVDSLISYRELLPIAPTLEELP